MWHSVCRVLGTVLYAGLEGVLQCFGEREFGGGADREVRLMALGGAELDGAEYVFEWFSRACWEVSRVNAAYGAQVFFFVERGLDGSMLVSGSTSSVLESMTVCACINLGVSIDICRGSKKRLNVVCVDTERYITYTELRGC